MNHSYNLNDLLGHSIFSKEYIAFASKFDLPNTPELDLDVEKNIYRAAIRNKKEGIILEFSGYRRYVPEFGEPLSIIDKNSDELILREITIDNHYSQNGILPNVKLPFDICFGDEKETLFTKLKKKPYEKSTGSYGYAWWFQFDDFRLLAALNHDYKLIWIRLFRLTTDEKEKTWLKKDLARQNKNINPGSAKSIINLTKELPTIAWRKRKQDGDELLTDKAIDAVEKLLSGYLQIIADFTVEKKASNIYNSVKKVVTSLNKINEQNDGFIETLEREELGGFLNVVVRKTGLEIDPGIDLTEQWREW